VGHPPFGGVVCALFRIRGQEVEAVNDGDLISFGEAVKRTGSAPATLRQMIKAGALPTYVRPLDRRFCLLRRQDVDALVAPRRLDPREGAPASA